jgi:hypothetical protein
LDTCHGVRLLNSMMVEGRKDGQVQTNTKPHNAALMTEALANLLVAKLNGTGHNAEACELLCDEHSTINSSLVDLGESQAPVVVPTSLATLAQAIEECLHQGLSPLAVLNHCNKTVLLG